MSSENEGNKYEQLEAIIAENTVAIQSLQSLVYLTMEYVYTKVLPVSNCGNSIDNQFLEAFEKLRSNLNASVFSMPFQTITKFELDGKTVAETTGIIDADNCKVWLRVHPRSELYDKLNGQNFGGDTQDKALELAFEVVNAMKAGLAAEKQAKCEEE